MCVLKTCGCRTSSAAAHSTHKLALRALDTPDHSTYKRGGAVTLVQLRGGVRYICKSQSHHFHHCLNSIPVLRSHSLTVPSSLLVTTKLSVNCRLVTALRCLWGPCRVCRHCPVVMSHTCMFSVHWKGYSESYWIYQLVDLNTNYELSKIATQQVKF